MSAPRIDLKVKSLKNQAFIADKCFVAERFFDRLIGLIGKRELAPGSGVLFPKCNNIHMWFMSIPIDVVFLRREKSADGSDVFRISSTHEKVKPWKVLPLFDLRATDTLELPTGTIARCLAQAGDEVVCLN